MTERPPVPAVPPRPSVGVVIPTRGRETLARSVRSALAQTYPPDVVVVVIDGPRQLLAPDALPPDDRVVVIVAGERRGPGSARNRGAARACTDLVAFLDDDDYWAPTKVEAQVEAILAAREAGAEHALVFTRQTMVTPQGHPVMLWPRRVIGADEQVADYLFTKREIRPGEAALGASMVLCDAGLVEAVPFDENVIHEDWDWVLRAAAREGTAVVGLGEALVFYTLQPPGACASSTIDWQHSLEWVTRRSDLLGRRQFGDFALSVTAPLAVHQRDWAGLRHIVTLVGRRRAGGLPAWAFILLFAGRSLARRLPVGRHRPRSSR